MHHASKTRGSFSAAGSRRLVLDTTGPAAQREEGCL